MSKGVQTLVPATSQLSLDVQDLLQRPGARRGVRFRAALEGLALPLARLDPGSDLDVDVQLESLVDGIHVRGTARGSVVAQCRRCLADVRAQVEVLINELFVHGPDAGDAEVYPIHDDHIDLEAPLRDSVVLAMPLNPVCREDCAGLCPTCGTDRNLTDCGHTEEKLDVRWEALERLRKKMEE